MSKFKYNVPLLKREFSLSLNNTEFMNVTQWLLGVMELVWPSKTLLNSNRVEQSELFTHISLQMSVF